MRTAREVWLTWSCVWNGAIFTPPCGGLKATCPPRPTLPVPTSAGDAGTSPRLTVDNINPLTNRMLLEYMGRRGIDADIAKAYCKEAYYHFSGRKDRRCFAVAFPNDKGGMELRN